MSTQQSHRSTNGPAVQAALHPNAALQAHFELLARKVQDWGLEREQPVAIGVTGIRPRSGTSTVCFNLASELAKTASRQVIMVEANFGRPFAVMPDPQNHGLGELLQATAEINQCIITTHAQNLFLLSAGSQTETAAKKLPLDCLSLLLREQFSRFQFVLFDLPPLDDFNASLPLACQMDGLIVVAEVGPIDHARFSRFRPKIHSCGTEIIGVVINKSS